MRPIRTLLVDNSRTFLAVAAALLSKYPRIELVGQANSGTKALKMVSKLRPDLVLVELALADMNGMEVTQRVKAMADPPTVILLTYFGPKGYRCNTTAVGADGFIAKDTFTAQLMPLVIGLFDRNCATESARLSSRANRTNAIRQHPFQAVGTLPG